MPTPGPTKCYQYVVTSSGPKILPVDEPSCKDEESPADYNAGGYLPVKVGDTFKNGHYKVIRKLGWGHFSTVWLVKDTENNTHSALKVVKSAGRYAETARDEIKLLSQVQSFSPLHPGRAHIVSFLDSFSHQGPEASHVCIVFEPLGENLLALIERNKKKGVPKALVRVIAKQALLALQYLHDECDLVHTDIKPENILISIPDIESHIYTELSQSPTPTSRRVGVPLPNKSRTGVSIQANQRPTRRQVQIFDSQPLSSPGRSAGINSPSIGMSLGPGFDHSNPSSRSGSGTNSMSNSYIPAPQISRPPTSSKSSPSVSNMTSSAPKVSSGLSMSAPHWDKAAGKINPTNYVESFSPAPSKLAHPALNSPSSSSLSSSLASTSTSNDAGSASIVSTPPTSLSHSLGNAVAGLVALGKNAGVKVDVIPVEDKERVGIPMQSSTSKRAIPETSSWKDMLLNVGSSFKDKVSSSISSSYKSTNGSSQGDSSSNQNSSAILTHSRSNSGAATSWKDPGLGCPAPAVVVNVVARGHEDLDDEADYLQFATSTSASSSHETVGAGNSTISSENSSSTVTAARPSPAPTDTSCYGKLPLSITETKPTLTTPRAKHSANQPSLLSQTAPPREQVAPLIHVPVPHPSPPVNISQLSAHMHSHALPSSLVEKVMSSNIPESSSMTSLFIPSPISNSSPPSSSSLSPLAPPPPAPFIQMSVTAPPPISIKIADMGNATPSTRHYTEDIQTRQYRAPEAILGRRDWDTRADIWSLACVLFELLTAEYLFDPQGQGQLFTKDDDHMAQIMELLGDFPLEAKMGGRYSRELFDHTGSLRYIRTLKAWPLKRVMMEKYLYTEEDADELCQFLEPMLTADFKNRMHARDMLNNKFLEPSDRDEVVTEW